MRNSKKLLLAAVGLIVLMMGAFFIAGRAAMGWNSVSGSDGEASGSSRDSRKAGRGSEITFFREVSDFDRILVEGEWSVDLIRTDGFSLEISHPDELDGHVSASVEGSTLVLSCDLPDCTDSDLEAVVGMPSLAALAVAGAADIGLSGFREETVEFDIEGAANVIAEESSAEELRVSIGGIGRMDLSGMPAVNARVDLDGAGWVKLAMEGGVLEGRLDGMGRIRYSGAISEEKVRIDGLGKVIRQ